VDADIDLPEAWDIIKGNPNVVVAVLDMGIDSSHSDLSANIWPGMGYNFCNDTSLIVPGFHATHVAGTIAANTNNTAGVSGIAGGSGTGNGVRLMSCQVFNPVSGGSGHAEAPIWAADHGACISQNSWAYTSVGVYQQSVLDAIDYFNMYGGGTVLNGGITIFAAGNNFSSGQFYPGCYAGTFAVAATNNQDMRAWYSNFDTWVDISAPGGETSSVAENGVLSTDLNNSYNYYQGTSMACPHVSGVAALIISLAPGYLYAQDVRDILGNSTDNIYPLNPGYVGKLGSGRLNAFNALQLTQLYLSTPAPQSLTATTTGVSVINLAWMANANNDSVLLVYNTVNTFGTPSGNYLTGQTIAGGGTVLYKGKLAAFDHTGLNFGTTYYYAIWTKNGSFYSVYSRKANSTTFCGTALLPFSESFGSNSMPICWTQQTIGTGTISSWSVSATANAGGTMNEMKSSFQNVYNGTTRLVTRAFNTVGISQINLSFRHMLDAFGTGATLRVQSSADGITFTDEAWAVPTSSSNINATLVNTVVYYNMNRDTTYLAFTIIGNLGNYDYWYIDNVSMTGVSSNVPLVFTIPVFGITATTGISGGNVTFGGSSAVTARGVCWGTSANPTLNNSHSTDGSGTGTFSSNMSGLSSNTVYHLRAYATNSAGTSYGNDIQFTTLCSVVNAFPWFEGFEQAGAMPSCWTQEQVNNSGVGWTFITGSGNGNPATAKGGTRNACLKDITSADNKTRLITPCINLSSIPSPKLTFWHTQAAWDSDQDRLSVFYKASAGGSWLLLASYQGNIPTWTQETILLPNASETYYISFEGNAKWGYGVCIDDVELSSACPAILPVSVSIVVSMNPVSSGTSVTFNAIAVNGGSAPSYQWKVNGTNAGDGLPEYTYIPDSGDIIQCVMISSEVCSTGNPASSNNIEMTVLNVPSVLALQNLTVFDNQCFNAIQTITIAGTGTAFTVQPGGIATIIAGSNILCLPGTTVLNGGHLHGFITNTSTYCGTQTPSMVTNSLSAADKNHSFSLKSKSFTIYPNPVYNKFTLESEESFQKANTIVQIFSASGKRLMVEELQGETRHEFSLAGQQPGIYFIWIVAGDYSETIKLIKY
jgi:hypothetical protein